MPRDCPVPHHTELEGPGCASGGFRVPTPAPWRGVDRRGHVDRRSPPAAELARCCGSGAASAHPL